MCGQLKSLSGKVTSGDNTNMFLIQIFHCKIDVSLQRWKYRRLSRPCFFLLCLQPAAGLLLAGRQRECSGSGPHPGGLRSMMLSETPDVLKDSELHLHASLCR